MIRSKIKNIISILITICILASMMPNVFAAQSNEYLDPADSWLSSNNRTNELDVNATITNETGYCNVCKKETSVLTYRVPEYTKSGETALNRNVMYSDGTMIGGVGQGNVDGGTPGVDAYYTGYHYTKLVCQTCGTLNGCDGPTDYCFNNNVYSLNSCDHTFFLDFDNTTYEYYNDEEHLTTLKKGEYCMFCKGTFARASRGVEDHSFIETVDAQLGNNRFYIKEVCDDCDFETSQYVTAKSVVSSYYGEVDGEAHTLTVSELSDRGVNTSIYYGNSADACTKTSAPNYTKAGYYTVYYKINYSYAGETMTENGVSYVWLVDESSNDNTAVIPTTHNHDYHYLETVPASCDKLGYDRFQCNGCGNLIKSNYTPVLGHDYTAITIKESTCEQSGLKLYLCGNCGSFYEETTPVSSHSYKKVKHNPTCRITGYTDNVCEVCGDSYITDITPIVSHAFETVTKEPTCVDKGYTTHTCVTCDYHYISDYTEPIGHNWDDGRTVTSSTCESEGVTEYTCTNDGCSETMIKATNANGHTPEEAPTCTEPQICTVCNTVLQMPTGHSYTEAVTAPTCTSMGYITYTCHCGDTYTGAYTDMTEHKYNVLVMPPTCTDHGFSVYACEACTHSYITDYIDKLNHDYTETVTVPTCTTLGYTTYTCTDCNAEYKSNYVEPTGHTASSWIIDTPATIENAGIKHIECTVCKTVLQTAEISKYLDRDFSDEDGNAVVGAYSIKLSDRDNMPVSDAEITIDKDDNVSINLPTGRLLDFSDRTTITVTRSETGETVVNLPIFVADKNENKATGKTDAAGILIVPNNQSSTGDDNGTIGGEDNDEVKHTYVVTVTDKTNMVIPNCQIKIGESNDIVVDLPDGIKPTRENPVIVTVTEHNGVPQEGVAVIAMGDADFVEKGMTDVYGKITLPTSSEGYTDTDGKVNVDYINVIVSDETGVIPDAYVKHNEDGSINVTLPDTKNITYDNRTTVTVLDSVGAAVENVKVTVTDIAENTYTDNTDKDGKIVVPPINIDYTDADGYSEVDGYIVTVIRETGAVQNANVTHNKAVKNANDVVETEENISIILPDGVKLDYSDRVTVTVMKKADNTAVKDMVVNISEFKVDEIEPKVMTGKTNTAGKVVFPPENEDVTDDKGDSGVTEEKPSDDKDTDQDGSEDEPVITSYIVKVNDTVGIITGAFVEIADGKITVTLPETHTLTTANQTTVTVLDKDSKPVQGVNVTVKDKTTQSSATTNANGQITVPPKVSSGGGGGGSSSPSSGGGGGSYTSVNIKVTDEEGKTVSVSKSTGTTKATLTLPSGKNLEKDNAYYTIKITDRTGKPKADYTVILKDRNKNELTGKTDKDGILLLPAIVHEAYVEGYNDGTFRPDNNMSRAEASAIFARLIAEMKNENITGRATFNDVPRNEWYFEYVGYLAKYKVIEGYDNSTFKPEANVTRSEFVSMAVRCYSLFNEVKTTGYTVDYTDVSTKDWAYSDIAYAKHAGWINGYADGTFKGNNFITRAEVVTIVNRLTRRIPDEEYINKNTATLNKYTDLKTDSHWAYDEIAEASNTHRAVVTDNVETWVK